MEEKINIQIINGRWSINGKPINNCSAAKKSFFDSFIKMKMIKTQVRQNQNFKSRSKEIKQNFNYKFKSELTRIKDNFLNNEPNINNLTFEAKI